MSKRLTNDQKRKKKIAKKRKKKEMWDNRCADKLISASYELMQENQASIGKDQEQDQGDTDE